MVRMSRLVRGATPACAPCEETHGYHVAIGLDSGPARPYIYPMQTSPTIRTNLDAFDAGWAHAFTRSAMCFAPGDLTLAQVRAWLLGYNRAAAAQGY